MMRYYRTVKELRLLNEILLQHYQEENPGRHGGGRRETPINRRFRAVNGFLDLADARVFERHPLALLELFHLLQLHPELKGVRAPAIRALRANLHRIDSKLRDDLRARSLFMEILRAPSGQTHALRRMNAYGVLGAYLPAFGAIVGQMQYDLFHVYTVDAHSLIALRNLRRFALKQFAGEFPLASELMSGVFKRERLYLAALFHDIAKGRGGDHSLLGEQEALAFCRKHDISEYDARFVAWLVRHHLLMSRVAQRQDISDHEVVVNFARTVGDIEHLNHLYLLSVDDIRATSPHVWNAWKARLLQDLYYATRRVLRQGFGEPLNLPERVRDAQAEALGQLKPGAVAPAAAREFWGAFEPDYFLRHDARDISWHLSEVAACPASQLPLVAARRAPEGGALTILVFAPESEELLSAVTGGMTRMNLDIAEARLHLTKTRFALYVFVVLEHGAPEIERYAHELRSHLLRPETGDEPRPVQLTRLMRHFPIEPQVDFPATGSTRHSVMDVIAQDHPGLLHKVALCLTACKVRLVNAKIATLGERAEDVFFVTDRDGRPLGEAQRECLRGRITEALDLRAPAALAASA
jgi:[protein-PII] uridylyltransferase